MREWGWMLDDGRSSLGVFRSRQDAIDDAENNTFKGDEILIGYVHWAEPSYYASADAEELFLSMEESAADAGFDLCTSGMFGCATPKGDAQKELDIFIKGWAAKHFLANVWILEDVWIHVHPGAGEAA